MKPIEITYTKKNGMLYPSLQISKEKFSDEQPVGKYGQMYLTYLKSEHSDRYAELKMSGELMSNVHKINDEVHKQIKELSDKIMLQYPKTEKTMQNFKHLNTCRAIAEEIILKELLYQSY